MVVASALEENDRFNQVLSRINRERPRFRRAFPLESDRRGSSSVAWPSPGRTSGRYGSPPRVHLRGNRPVDFRQFQHPRASRTELPSGACAVSGARWHSASMRHTGHDSAASVTASLARSAGSEPGFEEAFRKPRVKPRLVIPAPQIDGEILPPAEVREFFSGSLSGQGSRSHDPSQ